jgi:Protein of unknown function (DUF3108)
MSSITLSHATRAFRLPWRRGLCIAAVISLLAHGLSLNALNQSFDFKFNERIGNASLNTRVIQVVTPVDAGRPSDVLVKPIQTEAPASKSPLAVTPPQVSPSSSSAPAHTTLPAPDQVARVEPANLDQKQVVAGGNNELNATEIIANSTPMSAESSPTAAGMGSPAAQPTAAVRLQYPPNARLEFEALRVQRGQSTMGSGFLSWKSNGGEYELQIESSILGLAVLTQQSLGALDTMGLAPERFSDKRINRSEQAAHFRRALGLVQFSNNKPDAALLPGMQDRLSVLLQLAGIIGGDPKRYEIVNRISIPVAGLESAEIWEFSLEKALDITVPAANMRAIKLVRKPRNEFDQQLEVWLTPQLGYLPIRIRQSDVLSPEANFTDLSLKRLP